MLTAQDNATMVRAFYDAFNGRDMDKSLLLMPNNVKWTNIPFDVHFDGHQGYREFVSNWTTAMPDVKVEIVNVVAGDEWAAIEFIGRGTHTGPLAGPHGAILATQKKLELKCCEFLRIQDGLIHEGRAYFDAATMMRQLGVMPQTPTTDPPTPVGR